ncbi:beta strand repeat-containing protein [Alkanindiges illinoisensis]|uniref:beta strand repeat-containing protein n=1 Tax=Alkanindiges illinoisensis TaxID=197183 RepID=UPI000479E9EE|nr:hypothetical protein [Alkanindiges illinoisensis]
MTNFQLNLQKAKRFGVNLTVLATSISLAACGGGGSEGFYGSGTSGSGSNTGTGNATDTAEATGITLSINKDQLNANGDEVTVTAKAVDKDGGGVAGKKINLNISNAMTLGATSDGSEKTTDETGTVTFTIKLDGSNKSAQELTLTTTLVGTTINNVRKVAISGSTGVVQSQYEVKFDSVSSLKVTGGETTIRLRAVDSNGGGVPNQAVKLAIKDFNTQSAVSIKGVSTATTDNEGYASFTLQLAQGTEASRAALIESGVPLVATLTEQSGATKTQVTTVGVTSVANLVSSLTLTTGNNNKVDAIDGTISVVVNAKNPEGIAVANQSVSLALDEMATQYGAKLVNSTAKTDANGNATFTINTETNNLNSTGQLLVQNGITVNANLQTTDGSTVSSQSTKISVVSTITDEVSYLLATTPDQIEIRGDQAVITVTAVDKNGGTLANKKIVMAVNNSAQNGIVIKEGSQQTTDTNGKATFTLQFNATGVSATTLASLLANGVDVGVAYAKVSGGTVSQTTRIQFYTKQAENPAVDRLEMSVSKGVVNASNDSVEVKIRAIDEKGNAAANQSVKFELTDDATQNGVRFDGASSKVSDANGYVSYTLLTTAPNSEAIDKLIASGITAKATSGTASQTIQVMVQAAASETVAVSYLSMSADGLINLNKGQAKVTVKAIDNNGGVLTNRALTLKIADSQKNGLTLVGASKLQTDSEGKATFTVSYDGSITDQTLLNQLKTEGVLLTAEYQPANGVSSVTQTTRLRYYEQNVNADVTQLSINLGKGVAVAGSDSAVITVKALDENGQAVIGRKVSLSLTDVAKNNGVSFAGASSIVSDAAGEAKFTIKLAAPNIEAVDALTAAGILLTASAEQNTGTVLTQTAKLMVAATAQSQADVTYLTIDSLQSLDVTQSAERVVKVKVYNSSGAVVANKDISLALSKAFNGLSIKEGNKLTTNAAGEVSFTVVYNAAQVSTADKAALEAQGLTFTASYTGSQGTVSQSSMLAYYTLPANISRMDLLVDKGALVVDSITAQTVNAIAILKDNQGNPIANRQVTLALDNTALQNGVSFAGATGGLTVVSTNAAGQVSIAINVQPGSTTSINALVASGIGIGASAVQGDGSGTITQSTKVSILSSAALSEVGYLTATSSDSIATTGGTSVITVKAFNSSGTALKDKTVGLKLDVVPTGLDIKVDAASKVTAADGSAKFKITYIAPAGLSEAQIKALLAGINATAIYTNSAGTNTTQNTVVQFYADEVNISRMDLVVEKGLALVVNTTTTQTFLTTVTLKDKDGNLIKNRQVSLSLDNLGADNNILLTSVNFKDVIGGLTVVKTDANGQAVVALEVRTPTKESIEALVASGIVIRASAVQGDGSGTITQTLKMNVLSEATKNEVGYLTATSSDSIATTGGTSVITVKAFNSSGTALKDKTVGLKLGTIPAGLDIKVDAASKTTGLDGSATFNVTYTAPTTLTEAQIKALLAGINATAIYTNSAGTNTTQNTVVQFYADQVNIARMDLVVNKGALIVNTENGETVQAVITLKDSAGNAIKNRQVIVALDSIALQNGVSIIDATGSSRAVQTNDDGQAIVELSVKPDTAEKVATLVASGIGIGASAVQGDGSGTISQNIKINVVSQAALNEVGYLTATSSDSIATSGGTSVITVKAFNKDGTALTDKTISLKLNNVLAGLDVKVTPANATTDASGAKFTVTYTPAGGGVSADQIKALLAGINATATYTNSAGTNITQTTIVQFNVDANNAATDIQRLELIASKGVVRADNDTLTLSVKAFNSSGTVAAKKKISLGLNLAAAANGVTLSSSTATTNAKGVATFTLNINNVDEQKIKNLVANGIDLAAATILSDGTTLIQNTKVMAQSPESANPSVVGLQVIPSKQTVSTLGDSTDIVVRAVDKDGNALKDKDITFALAPNLSSRVTVDQATKITNSNGYVTFKVSVAAGTDPAELDLVQSGITFAVNTLNTDSPIPVTQVGKINVTVPQESTNLTISSSKPSLLSTGDSAEIYTKLVDQNLKPIKNSPVALTVVDSALNGVTIEGANNAITDASGNARFSIKLTKITGAQYQALLANGVTVRASITLSNGVVRTQDVHLNVNEAISQYHLQIDPDNNSLSVDGDKTLVVVTLLDSANQPVKNKNVSLTVRNTAAGIVINGTGSGITTLPQTVTTDELGRAFFMVSTPTGNFDKDLLIASGILLEASHTEENDAVTTQVSRLAVFRPSTSPSQTQPARYSLRISSAKPTLNVRNDSSDVTVTVVDANGGGVSGQYVTLSLADFARNGASILGASGLTTDTNGQAVFKVKVDETTRAQTYSATDFASDDLNVTATFKENGYFDAVQSGRINVVQAMIQQPVASIVIGVNPTEISASSDGVYYTRNLSASVVDFDGKPLANQEVALDITPLSYVKGAYSWDLVTDALGNQSEKWVYHDTVTCAASAAGTAITNTQVINIPVKVPTFLGSQGTTATYTTDAEGKFDFTIRYPKIYSQWLNIRIGAASTVTTLPTRTVYDLGLPSLANDYSTDGTYGPNLISPYGTNFTCP